ISRISLACRLGWTTGVLTFRGGASAISPTGNTGFVGFIAVDLVAGRNIPLPRPPRSLRRSKAASLLHFDDHFPGGQLFGWMHGFGRLSAPLFSLLFSSTGSAEGDYSRGCDGAGKTDQFGEPSPQAGRVGPLPAFPFANS